MHTDVTEGNAIEQWLNREDTMKADVIIIAHEHSQHRPNVGPLLGQRRTDFTLRCISIDSHFVYIVYLYQVYGIM